MACGRSSPCGHGLNTLLALVMVLGCHNIARLLLEAAPRAAEDQSRRVSVGARVLSSPGIGSQ